MSLTGWLDRREASESAVTMVTAVVVGVGAGLGAVVFRWLIGAVGRLGFGPPGADISWLAILLVPALGGMIVGPLVYAFAREAKGHGVPEVMEAVALKGGRIRPRVAVVKALASSICIGTGGSVGREGPIVQIGSALGSTVGQALKMSDARIRNLVACGAAGGIAATFNAPIAGAIFAIEVILGRLSTLYFGTVVISAVTADVVAQFFVPEERAFSVPAYSLISPWELLLYAALGVLAALLSVGFSRALYLMEDLWDTFRIPEYVKPAVGGLILGLVGLLTLKTGGIPRVFGVGYETISAAMLGQLAIGTTVVLLFAKMLATAITLGSGGSGGVFAPSLFMGAMLGATFGHAVNQWFPDITGPVGAYGLVGMAAFFSGAAHAPITAILILFEMTGDYRIILPLMLATVVSTVLSTVLNRDSIYTLKLARRGIRLEQGRDVDVLETITVGEVMSVDIVTVTPETTLDELAAEFARMHFQAFPVANAAGELVGMVGIEDLDRAVASGIDAATTVADIIDTTSDVLVAYPDESMGTALRRLGIRDVSRLPVLDGEGSKRLVGVVRRNDIVRAYNHAVAARSQDLHRAEELGVGHMDGMRLLQLSIAPRSPAAGRAVRDIQLPEDSLIVSLDRGGEHRVVRGNTVLSPGDRVTVVAKRSSAAAASAALVGKATP